MGKKSRGPKKALLTSFLFGSHCLSCSWLKFGSQDTFSQFAFLMFLDLCCRMVGNTVRGASQKGSLPWREGWGLSQAPRMRPPAPPRLCCCFLQDGHRLDILHLAYLEGPFPFSVCRNPPFQLPGKHGDLSANQRGPCDICTWVAEDISGACEFR